MLCEKHCNDTTGTVTVASEPSVATNASDGTPAQPLHVVLAKKLELYDRHTEGLSAPEEGAKVVKSGEYYSFQGPGYTQSIYRWLVGESQETTKQYIEELSQELVNLIDEAETMLEKIAAERREQQMAQFGRYRTRSTYAATVAGLRELIPSPLPSGMIKEIAAVLGHIDRMRERLIGVIGHVEKLYHVDAGASASDADEVASSESYDEDEPPTDKGAVYSTWRTRVNAAHTALCTASTSFRS